MPTLYRSVLITVLVVLIASCAAPSSKQPAPATVAPYIETVTAQPALQTLPAAQIARYPEPADFGRSYMRLDTLPKYDPQSDTPFQVDLRSRDLTAIRYDRIAG